MVGFSRDNPIERLTEVIEFYTSTVRLETTADSLTRATRLRGRLSFALHRKASLFGDVPVDQFWFPRPSLYGQRKQIGPNYHTIVNCFWARCMREGTVLQDEIQDSFILANLLPFARSNGSRRVFKDAMIDRPVHLMQRTSDLVEQLDQRLAQSRAQETDLQAFRSQTAILLGPPEYLEEVWQRYREMAAKLLDDGRAALQTAGEAGLSASLSRWRQWMRTVSRRRGNDLDKQILDIISYECRAAFHRAYSAVWVELLPYLTAKYRLSPESVLFHRLWHLEQCSAEDRRRNRFHLFHGHIFGLHPGTGVFAQTQTGRELIGAALREGVVGSAFRRLLTGIVIAMHDYADRSETIGDARRHRPEEISGERLDDELAEWQVREHNRRKRED